MKIWWWCSWHFLVYLEGYTVLWSYNFDFLIGDTGSDLRFHMKERNNQYSNISLQEENPQLVASWYKKIKFATNFFLDAPLKSILLLKWVILGILYLLLSCMSNMSCAEEGLQYVSGPCKNSCKIPVTYIQLPIIRSWEVQSNNNMTHLDNIVKMLSH